ncbi:UDP-2,4-diacetamido-2,4, 6-trideoxy-beta-L-altropyranose hydrolase [Gammaproteobacteria bacterium]
MKILVVIPARGGSKGIPRKNVRNMAGKPLIAWAIEMARLSRHSVDIVVSSEDEEILMVAKHFGAIPLRRPIHLADDLTTLDPVIHDAVATRAAEGFEYDIVATVQPTSPVLLTASFDAALDRLASDPEIDSILSAVNDSHLTWRKEGDSFKPNYEKRVNRQLLPRVFKETGGFFLTRYQFITPTSRMGPRVTLHELSPREAIDIDSYEDWNLCELLLKKKKILFVVLGNQQLGMGHVYRSLILAHEFPEHSVEFLTILNSDLAYEKIRETHFPCHRQASDESLVDAILRLAPTVVINDILDTHLDYITTLKNNGCTVINFEDLGEGLARADLVFNELYPEHEIAKNVFSGHEYFCLRDEFRLRKPRPVSNLVEEVLISFGGTDPLNLTRATLKEIYAFCVSKKINMTVILGLGYQHGLESSDFPGIELHRNPRLISEFMNRADISFTSGGRTVYEMASLGVPTVVICQNERELSHYFANASNGFINLGGGWSLRSGEILRVLADLVENQEKRILMQQRMLVKNLFEGKRRVVDIIKKTIDQSSLDPSGSRGLWSGL